MFVLGLPPSLTNLPETVEESEKKIDNQLDGSIKSSTTAKKTGRFVNVRETGISMPSKLNDMTDLRIDKPKVIKFIIEFVMILGYNTFYDSKIVQKIENSVYINFQDPSKFNRDQSDSSVTFSNSGSTLNGSTLGSETEDEENDEELAKYVDIISTFHKVC